jgi:CRP-like cAMP-binding protein
MEEPCDPNEQYTAIMTKFPLLSGFTVHGTRMLLELGAVRKYAADDTFWTEGEAATNTLLILRGRVQVFIKRKEGRLILRDCGPGVVLGDIDVVRDVGRTASVCASETSEVLEWSAQAFRTLLFRDGLLAERIHQHWLCALVEKEQALIASMVQPPLAHNGSRLGLSTANWKPTWS